MKKKLIVKSSKERIRRNIESWFVSSPLYFIIWLTHKIVENENIKSIRVNSGVIEYNPKFIYLLDDISLNEVLVFEVMRIILKHPYKREKENKEISYISSNITIKEYTKTSLDFPTAEEFFHSDIYNKKHFEFYYDLLINKGSNTSTGSANSEKLENGNKKIYLHNYSENTQNWKDDDLFSQIINDCMVI